MNIIDVVGGLLTLIVGLAFASLIFAPSSQAAQVISATGTSFSSLIGAAKAYPA